MHVHVMCVYMCMSHLSQCGCGPRNLQRVLGLESRQQVVMAAKGQWEGTVWRASIVALIGCFLGRLHVFFFSYITNLSRSPRSEPPPISLRYQLIMWLSGLRGGVAFAIAAASYAKHDFPSRCGGKQWAFGNSEVVKSDCERATVADDGMAVLQMTMMIAVFTTFVLGGLMPTVAERCDVKMAAENNDVGAVGHEDMPADSAGGHPAAPPPLNRRGSLLGTMDNKAAPLLHAKTAPPGILWRDGDGSQAAIAASPPRMLVKELIEESHGWLVRFLTHEEDYSLCEPEEANRFIGRGNVFHHEDVPDNPRLSAQRRTSVGWQAGGRTSQRMSQRTSQRMSQRVSEREWDSGAGGRRESYEPPHDATIAKKLLP